MVLFHMDWSVPEAGVGQRCASLAEADDGIGPKGGEGLFVTPKRMRPVLTAEIFGVEEAGSGDFEAEGVPAGTSPRSAVAGIRTITFGAGKNVHGKFSINQAGTCLL